MKVMFNVSFRVYQVDINHACDSVDLSNKFLPHFLKITSALFSLFKSLKICYCHCYKCLHLFIKSTIINYHKMNT